MCRISLNFENHFLEDLDYFNFCNFLNVFIFLVMNALIVETLNKYIQIQLLSTVGRSVSRNQSYSFGTMHFLHVFRLGESQP